MPQSALKRWSQRAYDFMGLSVAVMIFLVVAGCRAQLQEPTMAHFDSPTPMYRVMAAKWAGDHSVFQAIPKLVNLLEDEDRSVRLYAIAALKQITGTDQGYTLRGGAFQRAEAIARWNEYITDNRLGPDSEGIQKK
ncbi:MAG: HEAT repeat domain-containing protein [Phycisphaerae bacterium]|nr:HEAT repeat domain-containing protein [Phycisphaerae bacterium]